MKTTTMETAPGQKQFVTKECRTVRGRTCKCCGAYIDQMCFALFMMHDNGRQWVCVGFQCFSCERSGNETWM